jgi:SSS family solute:Na+ symporter
MRTSHLIDYVVIAIYLLSVAGIGLWVARRKKRTTEEYFLANRSMPFWAVGFSIVGTVISSVSLVALPGATFASNWWLIVPNMMVPFVLIFVVVFIIPFYRRVVHMSSYEYLEKRFGYFARLYGATGFLLLRTVDLGFTLLLTAIAVEVITGWEIGWVILTVGLFSILYTIVGGIEAVIWTDVLQGCVLATGALTILGVVLFGPEGGPAAVVTTAYEGGKFGLGNYDLSWGSLFGTQPVIWILALSGLMHFGRSYMTEPNMVQRYLVARSDWDARRGALAGALACLPIWLTFAFIGSSLWGYYQISGAALPAEVIQKPDNILPYFIATQFPAGLVGLILAAILSAANSSISSDLNSIGTVVTQDYFVRAFPRASERARLLFGRGGVLVAGLISIGIAMLLISTRAKAQVEMIITLGMIFAGGLLGLFALGFLSTRATRRGAYTGTVICLIFIIWAVLTGPLKIDLGFNFNMHPIMIGIFSHPLLFVTGYFASLFLGGAQPSLVGLTIWNRTAARSLSPDWIEGEGVKVVD